ncbi:MAG TPA: monovalent cation/H(+) antiporter subunit G [Roseiflexaceae bacterium]|nr:monovalent cation/H(+) antiporter subunit G [Roseiflexaceae bacterium]
MSDIMSDVLILTGAIFLLLAAVGVLRMPDLFTRMQSASKASTLGIACVLLALAFHFPGISVNIRVVGTIVFFYLTAPITAHLVGRAAYFVGVPVWKGTVIDELRGRYNPLTHHLSSDDATDNRPEA